MRPDLSLETGVPQFISSLTMSPTPIHTHEEALRKTAKQMGVTLKGELYECKGCSMAKCIRMSIPSKTHSQAPKRRFGIFVDLWGKKHVASMGGNKYHLMIVRDGFSRHA